MIWFAFFMACASPDQTNKVPDADPKTVPVTEVTEITSVEDFDRELSAEVVPAEALHVVFTGMTAVCDANEVELSAEALGAPEEGTATPWLDGIEGDPIALVFPEADSAFRLGFGDGTVEGCADATWVWEVRGQGNVYCKVSGPDTDLVLESVPECERH